MPAEMKSFLTPRQRYAAGALFAIAVHRAQIHQTRPLGLDTEDGDPSTEERTSSSSDSVLKIPSVGLQGIENVKVTDLIECHSSYLWSTQQILDRLELDVYYPVSKSTLHEQ